MTAEGCICAASFPALNAASAMIHATDCFDSAIRTSIFGLWTGVERLPENAAKLECLDTIHDQVKIEQAVTGD